MSKIARAFQNGKAFIPFITCGDPDLQTSLDLVLSMEQAGADLIELGIPFSDPTAEGPVIEAASLRSLQNGTTTDSVFELIKKIREKSDIPLVIMTYANVVFSYGIERFCAQAGSLGVDGLILPDVPFEEKDEFEPACIKNSMDWISMIAPTSDKRIESIAREAKGFLYVVSSMGTTGERSAVSDTLDETIEKIKDATDLPCAVGFGIHTPQQAKALTQKANGAIVGSAIVRMVGEHGKECIEPVSTYVRSMKQAMNQ